MSIKMNIIYVTVPSFLDLEISLIRELSRLANIKVLLIVQPESMHSSAFSLEKIMKRPCIVPATKYDGMQKYKDLIDLNVWDIANNPDNSFISCWNLSKLIKEYIKDGNFDIIHCTTKCKTMLFLQAYIKGLNNTLYTLHDPIPHAKASIIKEWVIDRYYNIYKNYLILSKLHKPIMEKIAPNKKTYISALGPYDFLNHYKTSVNSYGEYMLFTGKILHYKGVDILIKAYNKSNKAKLGIKLVIAGKGKIDGIEQLELNDNIILINRYIENEELASLISNCRFGVLPYRSATQSGVLMSFYAFNKPVIATRVGDFTQSIDDNKTGILCDANSVDSLAKAIDTMIACPIDTFTNNIYDQYNNKGDNSWSKIAFNLVTIYKRITNK